ncbi:glycosyltransferase family 2 protein [Cyanothece sp. BG0011]|uniref:glycosyltransferase n=1 Tax=Cyanothece sp. BG0011 TaxID=2082950 RepID=UPI000D1E356A|nr:glycosyltransferase family 2 protein [Cyanothece sp. BG0011]
MNVFPMVSIIIPVYNDGLRLKKCLEALENQSYPTDNYEVIVIDNASDEEHNIKDIVSQFSQAHYTYEAKQGSYAARNKGLTIAKGEIIAFTDSDCIPTINWLKNGVNALLANPNCGLIAGKIELFFRNPSQPTAIELYESVTAFPQEKLLAEYHGAATANVFTYRHIFDEVGCFDDSLKSNGDLEWGNRVYEKGYEQIYAEEVCIFHPARHSWSQLYQRTIRLASGSFQRQSKALTSSLQKQLLFLGYLRYNLTPPINFLIKVFRDQRFQSLEEKLQVSLVMFFVRYSSAWELLRVKFGKESARL